MLLAREIEIIRILYEYGTIMTTSEVAAVLQVSSRTIKSDLKNIHQSLENMGCFVETRSGKGIRLRYSDEGNEYLRTLLYANMRFPDSLSTQTRKYYVALELLDATGYISSEQIAEKYYVSKGTIINEVNVLESFFSKWDIEIERKAAVGFKLNGFETQLRIARATLIRKLVSYQGNLIPERIKDFFDDVNIVTISKIVQAAEEKFSFVLTDISYTDLLIHLATIIQRVRNSLSILEEEGLQAHKNQIEWRISEFIAARLERSFDVVIKDNDIANIYMNLTSAKHLSNVEHLVHDDTTHDQEYLVWEKIILSTDRMFSQQFGLDETFKQALYIHIKTMVTRLQNGLSFENPMKEVIKKELAYEVEVASYIGSRLFTYYGLDLKDDEICDIALYVGASLERKKANCKKEEYSIVVICGAGAGTSQLILAKLHLLFPQITEIEIIPISRVDRLSELNFDFVISTVPVETTESDILYVSPLLNEEDIDLIEKRVNHIRINPKPTIDDFPVLTSHLSKDITILNAECLTRDEVINYLGRRMIQMNYVSEDFVDSVFEREKLSATSIGGVFALPHALAGDIKKQGIGLITLKKPVKWGNENVSIVLMLSIDVKNQNSFLELFSEVVDLMKTPKMIEGILSSEKFNEVINLLKG